jgi:hypothetical protein
MPTPQDNDTDAILAIAHQLGLEPAATQAAFNYCLCQLMVEAGRMRLVAKTAGADGPLCHFLSADGKMFLVPEPALTAVQLTQLKTILRQIWLEEGGGNEP